MTRRQEFSPTTKRKRWDHAGGICESPNCDTRLDQYKRNYHYDHLLPCALGGDNSFANCRVICTDCHRTKTGTEDVPRIRKADRQKVSSIGAKAPPNRPIQSRGFPKRDKTGRIELETLLPPPQLYRRIR